MSQQLQLSERDLLFYAALFHDIGKLPQRATGFQQVHELLSARLAHRIFAPFLSEEQLQQLLTLIETHHQRTEAIPASLERLATIIHRADSLAAAERQHSHTGKLQLQHSIFSTLYQDEASQSYQPLCSLMPEAYEFPISTAPDAQHLQKQYSAHLQQMENEIQSLAQNAPLSRNRLLFFLRKYLWCVPAAYYMPDVSLYEHSKLTAALAVALYDYLHFHSDEPIERSDTARYILAVGDLSGIQSYLYDISYKGAAKALKGRSFLLQLLTEIVATDILERLDYSFANLLYSGGGKFFLLLPNTEQVQQVLRAAREDTEQFFADEFDAVLGLSIGTTAFTDGDLQNSATVARLWGRAIADAKREQLRAFATTIHSMDFFLNPSAPFGYTERCAATNRDLYSTDQPVQIQKGEPIGPLKVDRLFVDGKHVGSQLLEVSEDGNEEIITVAPEQERAQRLGYLLRSHPRAIAFARTPLPDSVEIRPGRWWVAIPQKLTDPRLRDAELVQLFNDDRFLDNPHLTGWRFYAGTWAPQTRSRKPLDFTDLVQEHAQGLKRLAVLRMDVDNLGSIFAHGFGTAATFSRMMQLSAMLDFFFSSYLNRLGRLSWSLRDGIVENESPESKCTPLPGALLIVYAGGDDLFIVGPWQILPDVALWIRERFREFTGHHPRLSISGGIALFGDKFPIFRAAQLAQEAEEAAKHFERANGRTKDAITFFDVTMDWQDFATARKITSQWIQWVQQNILPRSFLHRLIELYRAGKRQHFAPGPWQWRGAYHLARLAERLSDDEARSFIQKLAANVFVNPETAGGAGKFDIYYLAAQWTVSYTRGES